VQKNNAAAGCADQMRASQSGNYYGFYLNKSSGLKTGTDRIWGFIQGIPAKMQS